MAKRHGPSIHGSCHSCEFYRQERFAVQGDTGHDGYCQRFFAHPEKDKHIGTYAACSVTPEWCPELSPVQSEALFPDATDHEGHKTK